MNRALTAVGFLLLALGLVGCTDRPSPLTSALPIAPSPQPVSRQPTYGVFAYVPDVTLSGIVYETIASVRTPVEGVAIYCDACTPDGHTSAYTDPNGFYTFTGMWLSNGPLLLMVGKEGYGDPIGRPVTSFGAPEWWREVVITGDTLFDMELVKQ